jgi:hypothetical protein
MTEGKLAASRTNGRRSRGAKTPAGKARAAAAGVRHGFYSQTPDFVLWTLGENPADFARLLESLRETWAPSSCWEEALVERLARATWRMKRSDRVLESMAYQQVERGMESKQMAAGTMLDRCQEAAATVKRLADLVADPQYVTTVEAIHLYNSAYPSRDLLRPDETFALLRRLGMNGDGDPHVSPGPEREADRQKLQALLETKLKQLQDACRIFDEEFGKVGLNTNRDAMMAANGPQAALMLRMEESSLRQIWRITNLLIKIKKGF